MDPSLPPDDPDRVPEPADLVPLDEAGRQNAALVHWLEQSHRDAQANRAQARELIAALDRAREGNEYVGRALRDERRKGRFLLLALAIVPFLAVLVVWALWDRMDAVRTDVADRVDDVLREQESLRREQEELARSDLEAVQKERVAGLDAEIERLRSELITTREGLVTATRDGSEREEGLRARLRELETAQEELLGLRAEVRTLRSRTGAETARNEALEREIRELERALGDARARAETARPLTASPLPVPAEDAATAAVVSEPAPPTVDPDPAPPPEVDPYPAASRRPEDLERIRGELNRLLGTVEDAVSYRVERIGGVSGEALLDVRVLGLDDLGQTIRALEAGRAEVTVQRERGQVRLSFQDGHLELAGRRAPFFEGRYALELASDPEPWRISGLTCVRFE